MPFPGSQYLKYFGIRIISISVPTFFWHVRRPPYWRHRFGNFTIAPLVFLRRKVFVKQILLMFSLGYFTIGITANSLQCIIIIFITHLYFFSKLPKNKFMIGIEFLINDSAHKNTQSLDTVIKIHNDVPASNFCHSQI